MTKADIAERISSELGYTKNESIILLESTISLIKETLKSGNNLNIAGFGNFEVKHKRDRKGRNPQTGETITIEARRVLTFKPSSMLKTKING